MPTRTQRRTGPKLFFLAACLVGVQSILAGCGSCRWNLKLVDYTSIPGQDWQVSTPQKQCLDSTLLSRLYFNATKVKTIQALLVVKNGYLIAEQYFHGGGIDQMTKLQSATKSVTSALVGIVPKTFRLHMALSPLSRKTLRRRPFLYFPNFFDTSSK